MKNLTLLLLCLSTLAIAQQKTYVPDDNFEQKLINSGYDNVLDDSVLTSNIKMINYLDLSYLGINDLTGISDFDSINELDCSYNNLSTLDLSGNTRLEELFADHNNLDSLDLSSNQILYLVHCDSNRINTLICPPSITHISCRANKFEQFDVSNYSLLRVLDCSENLLTGIDVSNNPQLIGLICNSNLLDSVAISNNPGLHLFWAENNNISTLDFTSCPDLISIIVNNNQLTSIDITNSPKLEDLLCDNNLLQSVDISNNLDLETIHVDNNQIQHIDVSNHTKLTTLRCGSNALNYLNVQNGNNNQPIINGWTLSLNAKFNPYLTCIQVDDTVWSNINWGFIDPQHYFSLNCGTNAIEEVHSNKILLKIVDILGKETKPKKNTPLFYIYNDGTVEKKIVVE